MQVNVEFFKIIFPFNLFFLLFQKIFLSMKILLFKIAQQKITFGKRATLQTKGF
jgi:hypothetical protein